MRWSSRQRSIRVAVSVVLAGLGLFAVGCDDRAADSAAVKQMRAGDYKAAAAEKDVSPAIAALAASRAADEQHAKALPTYRDLASNQVMLSDAMWYLARLSTTASQVQASVGYLSGYNPKQALATLDQIVQAVKGDGQQSWSPANVEVQMPTIAALTARSNQLRDQITEIQNNLTQLRQKQQSLMQQSEKLLADSNTQKGEQSLQTFRQASDTRKQATQVAIQVAQAEAALVPVQQELATVEDQAKLAGESLNVMTSHREDIEKSWRGISAQADQRASAVAAIFAASTPERPGTIPAQAARLADLLATQDKLASSYEQQLTEAASYAKTAASSADRAVKEIQLTKAPGTKAKNPNELAKVALDPSTARFDQGHIEYSLGSYQAGRAALLATRARVLEDVAQTAGQLKQQLPQGLDAAAAKADSTKVAAEASTNLAAAADSFSNASGASPLEYTKRSATIGQMMTLQSQALLANSQGDAATSKQYLDEAKALREQLQQSGQLPGLPTSAAPAAPAAPAVEQ